MSAHVNDEIGGNVEGIYPFVSFDKSKELHKNNKITLK